MGFYSYFWILPRNNVSLFVKNFVEASSSIRDIHIAVKSESTIPMPSIRPNHLIRFTQKMNKMIADVSDVT